MICRFRLIVHRGKLISTSWPVGLAKLPHHAIISAPRLLPSPSVRCAAACADSVTLAQVAVYIHEEIKETFAFDDIFYKLSKLVDLVELPNNGSITRVSLDDAIMFIEEIGVDPANFKDFLARDVITEKSVGFAQLPQEDVCSIDTESHDISEYDFVQSSDQLLTLARRHGAKVTPRRGGGARIITASGVEIVFLRDGRGSWSGLERKRTLMKFKAAGLTFAEPDENAPLHCTWCKKFLTMCEAKACRNADKSMPGTLCWNKLE